VLDNVLGWVLKIGDNACIIKFGLLICIKILRILVLKYGYQYEKLVLFMEAAAVLLCHVAYKK